MKKISIILILLFCNNVNLEAQTILHKELLGRPSDTSITIQSIYTDSVEIRVEYGKSSGVYTNSTPWQVFAPNIPAEIIVSGLTPNAKYFYRLNYRRPSTTTINNRPEYSFQTQRPKGSSFSFVVQADPHLDELSDTLVYSRCLQNQLEDNPDFMIDLGDFLMTDKLRNSAKVVPYDTIPYRCHLLRSYYEKVCHSVPLYIAIGNHEGEAGWNLTGTSSNIAVWNTLERKRYFLNPAPNNFYSGDTTNHPFVGQRENYYAWTWGDALFIVLDPYWYTNPKPDSLNGWRWTIGINQYNWLRNTLENSDATFKFVFAHQIIGGDPDGRGGVEYADLYEWGGKNLDGSWGFATNRSGWYKPIKDLLTENKVNIFFHGHDHFFGKQEKNCLIYQETPQPSHPNYTSTSYATDYGYVSGQILPNSGHIRVSVDPNGTKVEYVRAYKASAESASRHNKDIAATYYIGKINCYDSLSTGVPVLWNSNYADELIYPNPFKQETKIEFNLNTTEKITISIFNEEGQLVRRLMNENIVNPGNFQIIWDGKSSTGSELANGLYFYKISSKESGNKSGKIILQR